MITTDDIKKLAELSRLSLTPEEEKKLAGEISGILGYIDQIKNTAGMEAKRIKEPVRNIFRDDKNPHESGIHTDALVAEFPKKDGNYLKVKKILG